MYSMEKRRIAIHIYSIVKSLRKTALLCQTSHSTISRWINNPNKKIYTKPNKIYKSDQIVDIIKLSIANDPFISIIKLQNLILSTLQINVSKELIRVSIKKQGFTKKNARFYGEPKTLITKIKEFLELRNKYIDENRTFISIDETSFGRNGIIIKGYSKKGQKLFIRKNKPRMTTTSVVAAFSSNELIGKLDIKGSINTNIFIDFINSINLQSGMVIIMDNISFHHSLKVKELCKSKNIEILYTPPYSPWYNPIELCFSIVKRHYYKYQDINKAFNSINEDHLLSFFNKSLNCINIFL